VQDPILIRFLPDFLKLPAGLPNRVFQGIKTDAETEKLVTDINAERKASYQQLAKQNNVSVDDIAKLAGQKLVARAKPGEYVQGINGKWVRKF